MTPCSSLYRLSSSRRVKPLRRPVPSRERGRRPGLGVHLARLLSAAVTGLVVLTGAALVLPPRPADLSARLPHVISKVATALQRAAGLADGGAQVAIRTDALGAPVEAQSDEVQVAVPPDEPADAVPSSPAASGDALQDAGPMTVQDAAPTSSPQEVPTDAQVTVQDDAPIQPADEVAGATLSESARTRDAMGRSAERQAGHEAGAAVAAPAAVPLTSTADAPPQPPEDLMDPAPVASPREAEDIGEGAVTMDRQAGDGSDRGAAELKAERFTTTADTPVRAPEDVMAGTPPVSATDTEGAIESTATTELLARDAASRGAAEPRAEPLAIAPKATPAGEVVRVTAERLNVRDGPNTSAAVVGTFDRGTRLTVLDRDGPWVKAQAPDGRSGWLDTESAAGGAVSAERQTGHGASVAVAAPAAEPLTSTADTPVQAPEDVAAGTSSVSATAIEGAAEDATTTELQARDMASRGAAEPKAEATEASSTAPSADEMVRVTAERLNMRDGPGTNAAVVGAFDRGTQLRVVDRDGEWVKAEAPDDRSGWLSARFLETLSDAKVAVEGATTAGLQAGEVTTGTGGERASEPLATAPTATPAGEVVRVTAERLNMRDGPSTGAAVVGAFDRGTQLTVVDRDGRWIRAQAPDGRSGWLSARFLEKPSDGAVAASEDPLAREATRLGAAEQAAEPVSSAAAALAGLASQVPRRN